MKKISLLRNPLSSTLLALLVMFFWGSLFPMIKIGYNAFGVDTSNVASILLFAGLRFLLCGAVLITVSGAVYVSSAGVIHLLIGSLADWTSTLGPLLGREETAALVLGQYQRLTAALILPYFGMIALILTSFWAVASGRSILPRKMALVHMLVWQIVLAGIPDLRQAVGAEISTWDFVLSQGSGNAALLLWMLASALCADRTVKGGMEHA